MSKTLLTNTNSTRVIIKYKNSIKEVKEGEEEEENSSLENFIDNYNNKDKKIDI